VADLTAKTRVFSFGEKFLTTDYTKDTDRKEMRKAFRTLRHIRVIRGEKNERDRRGLTLQLQVVGALAEGDGAFDFFAVADGGDFDVGANRAAADTQR
jgi:hypothetical protein